MAESDSRPTGDQEGSIPAGSREHSFVESDHEIFSMVSLSLPLIQEGQLSASGNGPVQRVEVEEYIWHE